jgi:hypothetical protein
LLLRDGERDYFFYMETSDSWEEQVVSEQQKYINFF